MDNIFGFIITGEPDLTYWPKARLRKPRFLIKFGEEETILARNYNILGAVCSSDKRYIVAPEAYIDQVQGELSNSNSHIVVEPSSRGSFCSLALAVAAEAKNDTGAVVVAIPPDLCVRDEEEFVKSLKTAVDLATTKNVFVTIGTKPTYPEPDYYYIKVSSRPDSAATSIFDTNGLLAQPGKAAATRLLQSNDEYWCSGVLVFTVNLWWKYLKKFQLDLMQGLKSIRLASGTGFYKRVVTTEYQKLKTMDLWSSVFQDISQPRSKALALVETQAQWALMNSWRSVSRIGARDGNGNLTSGPTVTLGSTECILETDKSLLVSIGLQDIVVIATDDVILVCNKNRQEDVKAALSLLRTNGMTRYL